MDSRVAFFCWWWIVPAVIASAQMNTESKSPAMAGQPATKKQIVLGYSASWQDARYRPVDYNYPCLSYLARSFLVPHPDGSLYVPEAFFNPRIEALAHKNNVKLLMSIGGEAKNADNWLSLASDPKYLNRFLDQAAELLARYHYDGFDIDWEPAPLTSDQAQTYLSFMKTLRARFPKATITTALPAGEYWISQINWAELTKNVDYINVMTYDYSGSWGTEAAHASNLFPSSIYQPQAEYSADEGMQNLIKTHHVPPNKLLMGLTFWGYRFRANHLGDRILSDTAGYEDNLSYSQIESLLSTDRYDSLWDDHAQMPYLQRKSGGSVVCYENTRSITRKCEYAKTAGCAGVMIWSIGSDICGTHAPLMDAVAQSTGSIAAALSRGCLEHQVADILSQTETLKPETQKPKALAGVAIPAGNDFSQLSQQQVETLHQAACQQAGLLLDQPWHDRHVAAK